MKFTTEGDIRNALIRARALNLVDEADTTILYYDISILRDRLHSVREAFPSSAIHCVAIKANPLKAVLQLVSGEGFALEAASFEEVVHALRCGAKTIAWDSPVKTHLEFQAASSIPGLFISCDTLEEAGRLFQTNLKHPALLRINPQMESRAHQSMSVATPYAKFGEPMANRKQIIDVACSNTGVVGLHVHTSSQTNYLEDLTASVRAIVDLALEIDAKREFPLTYINIGGGFPVDYLGQRVLDVSEYADLLMQRCPELKERYRLITEFGRYYHANAAFTSTVISHIKRFPEKHVLVCHAGADMFLRESYQGGLWPHRYMIFDSNLKERLENNEVMSDIAGPLCFGGDYIAKDVKLPLCQSNDLLIIRDTGANSVALWSKHCSRAFPKCITIDGEQLTVIRERDTLDRNLAVWG